MDIKKYKNTKEQLSSIESRLKILEEIKLETLKTHTEVLDSCNHDFVLVYSEEPMHIRYPEQGSIKHAKCLICEKNFRLNEHYIDFETEEYLQSKNIIDATLFLSDYTQRLMRGQDNVAFIEAKQVFDSILNADTGCLNDNDYTNEIRLKVFELDQYYINLEEQRRKDSKEEVTKKKK